MTPTTHPFGNPRPDHEGRAAALDVLGFARTALQLRGHHRAAKSVETVCGFLDGYASEEVVHAGLTALMEWARQEAYNPLLVRAGDRVRVFLRNGPEITTGVWKRDQATGAPLVQRDDTGEDLYINLERHRIEVIYLDPGSRTGGTMTGALWAAATVLRSAWLPRTSKHLDDPQEWLETDDERDERDKYLQRRKRERLCECGQVATWRAVAWAEREAFEYTDDNDDTVTWHEPADYGSETVCSPACGEKWARKFMAVAVLPPELAPRFRLDRFTYSAEASELPTRLMRARSAARRAAMLLDDACTAHVSDEPGSVRTLTQSAQGSVAELLDAVLLLTTPRVV